MKSKEEYLKMKPEAFQMEMDNLDNRQVQKVQIMICESIMQQYPNSWQTRVKKSQKYNICKELTAK